MSGEILQALGLGKAYPSGTGSLEVLRDCSLAVAPGERVAIVGPSGVGKSTLLHLLAGLDRPDTGRLLFRDRDLAAMTEAELASYRSANVGMVFQFYHLLSELTALENVMLPLLIGSRRAAAIERASFLLSEAGLEDRSNHFPSELSGGERQRVAIARALACEPALLLADEPTGNLDVGNGVRIMQLFGQMHSAHGMAMVMVTHNPDLVADFDRVLQMGPGGKMSPMSVKAPAGRVSA